VPKQTVDPWLLTELVTRLRRVLRASIRTEYPWESLPMAQVELLQRLREEPGLRLNDLATRHRLATNTVSMLVRQLVASGLVTRTTHPDDRRAVMLELTDDGQRVLADWQTAHERRLAGALNRLPAADQRTISAALPALSRLVDVLEQDA
jgi:DNA-binding MarR family transcriptional regulator